MSVDYEEEVNFLDVKHNNKSDSYFSWRTVQRKQTRIVRLASRGCPGVWTTSSPKKAGNVSRGNGWDPGPPLGEPPPPLNSQQTSIPSSVVDQADLAIWYTHEWEQNCMGRVRQH